MDADVMRVRHEKDLVVKQVILNFTYNSITIGGRINNGGDRRIKTRRREDYERKDRISEITNVSRGRIDAKRRQSC